MDVIKNRMETTLSIPTTNGSIEIGIQRETEEQDGGLAFSIYAKESTTVTARISREQVLDIAGKALGALLGL